MVWLQLLFNNKVIMKFEWDIKKSKNNEQKHKIDFETASRVFLDPDRYDEYDVNHDECEERWKTTGLAGLTLLMVIYTERGPFGEIIRIISARKANERERRKYYEVRA
jgi:uncharacterized DUF497 family protein